MYRLQHRRYLTLIEMIVVMTIISFVAGVVGINVSKAMQEQRFRTEVALVLDKLRLAQNLMLILNEDVKVQFKSLDQGVQYNLSFQCPLNKGWDKELSRQTQPLTAIRKASFREFGKGTSLKDFSLNFLSGGMVMSRGVLTLSTGNGYSYKDKRYICLHGYPRPMTAVSSIKQLPCLEAQEIRKDEQLTQYVMPEIIRQFQARKSGQQEP
jgi:type II secretory pathway pseudopilin PulG